MFSLPTAKTLFFIAACLGPHNPTTIYATSNSESYVWSQAPGGWEVTSKAFPASDFTRNPAQTAYIANTPSQDTVPDYLKSIAQHDWRHDSVMIFDNGDRVEKAGDHAFYIINAGGANEKVFTILYPNE